MQRKRLRLNHTVPLLFHVILYSPARYPKMSNWLKCVLWLKNIKTVSRQCKTTNPRFGTCTFYACSHMTMFRPMAALLSSTNGCIAQFDQWLLCPVQPIAALPRWVLFGTVRKDHWLLGLLGLELGIVPNVLGLVTNG